MYVRLECPDCQAVAYVLARKPGSEVPCPDCGRPVRVLEPSPEEPVLEVEAPPDPAVEGRRWNAVDRGLGLVKAAAGAGFAQAVCTALLIGLWLLRAPEILEGMNRPGGADLEAEAFLGGCLSLFSSVLTVVAIVCLFVGRLLCPRVPGWSGARGLARAAFTALLLTLGISLLLVYFTFLAAFEGPLNLSDWGVTLLVTLGSAGVTLLAGELFFLAFLARLGRALGRPALSRAVERFVLVWVLGDVFLAAGSYLCITFLGTQVRAGGPRVLVTEDWTVLVILFLAWGAFWLYLFGLYLGLLDSARDAIRQRPGASPEGRPPVDAPTIAAPGRS